jgi:hypothetical protein
LIIGHGLRIQPSESWGLDIVEINKLTSSSVNKDIDLSVMLNFERIKNGADRSWLQKN